MLECWLLTTLTHPPTLSDFCRYFCLCIQSFIHSIHMIIILLATMPSGVAPEFKDSIKPPIDINPI